MFAFISTIIGDPFFAGLAALALGVVAYLVLLTVRERRERGRRHRHQIRREFWGYD